MGQQTNKEGPEPAWLTTNTLVQGTWDPNPAVRALTLKALRHCLGGGGLEGKQAGEAMLGDPSPYVRRVAVQTSPPDMPRLQALQKDPDPGVALSAAHLLPAPDSTLLWRRLASLPEWYLESALGLLRHHASFALGDHESTVALNLLDRHLTHRTNPAVAFQAQNLFLDILASDPALAHLSSSLVQHILPYLCGLLSASANTELNYSLLEFFETQLCRGEANTALVRPFYKQFFTTPYDPAYLEALKFRILIRLVEGKNSEDVLLHLLPQIRKEHFTASMLKDLLMAEGVAQDPRLVEVLALHFGLNNAALNRKLLNALCDMLSGEKPDSQLEAMIPALLAQHSEHLPLEEPLAWLLGRAEGEHVLPLWEHHLEQGDQAATPGMAMAVFRSLLQAFFQTPAQLQEMLGRQMEQSLEQHPSHLLEDEYRFHSALLAASPTLARTLLGLPASTQ